ncbi:MAG: amidohydrolase family protein, partial [Gammaproteobacteria bacterium]|nr:amidohydrolase family protein [Gammaproteobacteria bacterium]
MQTIDTLIHARWVLPIEPPETILEHYAIALDGDSIVELLPSAQAIEKYQPQQSHTLESHVVMPGLINTHTHSAMSLMRGLADDLPLMSWLQSHIWPTESRWVSDSFVEDGSALAIAEMVRGGVTCFNDMYFFPEVTAQVAIQAGMRAVIGLIVLDFPSAWGGGADEYIEKGLTIHQQYHNSPHIHTAFAPHAPYTVSDAPLERIQILSAELDLPIHMHIHETA